MKDKESEITIILEENRTHLKMNYKKFETLNIENEELKKQINEKNTIINKKEEKIPELIKEKTINLEYLNSNSKIIKK